MHGIPDLSSWCEYSVLRDDTLQGIAGVYGLHWMTLFLMNNHTLLNPADLVPGNVMQRMVNANVTRRTSHVTCHTSLVTRHTSHLTRYTLQECALCLADPTGFCPTRLCSQLPPNLAPLQVPHVSFYNRFLVIFFALLGVLYAINQPLFLDQQRVYPGAVSILPIVYYCNTFTGTIICVAPGSENVNCRQALRHNPKPLNYVHR